MIVLALFHTFEKLEQIDRQGTGAFQGPRFQKLIGQRLLERIIDGP